ncbi:hypothetical protein M0812_04930 [Anaeramoeba flamelloides]|uniref:Myb-like domain-containing protein n=1 Tax=Anaeramoeba flamelloides TaxID=1746091 RepID=A0AAV8AEF9_9EUKA|nr:hypothetical protein M0812_04930 [Anaeramoeba flamelloides]
MNKKEYLKKKLSLIKSKLNRTRDLNQTLIESYGELIDQVVDIEREILKQAPNYQESLSTTSTATIPTPNTSTQPTTQLNTSQQQYNKGPWKKSELDKLKIARQKFGANIDQISKYVETRNLRQCHSKILLLDSEREEKNKKEKKLLRKKILKEKKKKKEEKLTRKRKMKEKYSNIDMNLENQEIEKIQEKNKRKEKEKEKENQKSKKKKKKKRKN